MRIFYRLTIKYSEIRQTRHSVGFHLVKFKDPTPKTTAGSRTTQKSIDAVFEKKSTLASQTTRRHV